MISDDDSDDDDDDDGGTWSQGNAISQRGIMEIDGWPNYSATAKMPPTRPRIIFTVKCALLFPHETNRGDQRAAYSATAEMPTHPSPNYRFQFNAPLSFPTIDRGDHRMAYSATAKMPTRLLNITIHHFKESHLLLIRLYTPCTIVFIEIVIPWKL